MFHTLNFIIFLFIGLSYWTVLNGFSYPYVISQGLADKGPIYGPRPGSWDKPRMARR